MGNINANLEILNTLPVLNSLKSFLTDGTVKGLYLTKVAAASGSSQEHPVFSSVSFGLREERLPEVLTRLGIRSIILDANYDLSLLSKLDVALPPAEVEKYPWTFYKDETVIDALRTLFNNCRTIAFDDWSAITGASDLWDGLLHDVIGPTGKKNLEIIFYLGDPQGKLSFEVDEAIDIFSAFSFCGKVTFALDQQEALGLWMLLNGVSELPISEQQLNVELKRKYYSIFRTIEVSRLLIYSSSDATVISAQEQFVISRKKVNRQVEIGHYARQNFVAGFSLGLVMQFDLASCIALGLIIFGSQGESFGKSERPDLTRYLENWIADLEKPDAIYLYQ